MSTPPLAIDRAAPIERIAFDDTSWVEVIRGIVIDPEALTTEALERWPWRPEQHFRYEVTLVRDRLVTSLPRTEEPDAVRQLGLHLNAAYRVRFDGPGIFHYPTGSVAMGFHRDREMRWLDNTLIAILSLGATRPLGFRPHGAPFEDTTVERRVELNSGDMVVMGGRFQRDWLHGVPRTDTTEPRLSLTWRWTSRTGEPDHSEAYSAPRHFSDAPRGPARRRPPR